MAKPDDKRAKAKLPTAKEVSKSLTKGKNVGGKAFKPIDADKAKKNMMPRKRGM